MQIVPLEVYILSQLQNPLPWVWQNRTLAQQEPPRILEWLWAPLPGRPEPGGASVSRTWGLCPCPQGHQGGRAACLSPPHLGLQSLMCEQLVFDWRAAGATTGRWRENDSSGHKPANWPFQLHLNLQSSTPLLAPSISLDAGSLMP